MSEQTRIEKLATAMKAMVRARQDLDRATADLPPALANQVRKLAWQASDRCQRDRGACAHEAINLLSLARHEFQIRAAQQYTLSARS